MHWFACHEWNKMKNVSVTDSLYAIITQLRCLNCFSRLDSLNKCIPIANEHEMRHKQWNANVIFNALALKHLEVLRYNGQCINCEKCIKVLLFFRSLYICRRYC